ncbi:hypothetical protein R80B4_00018 [Fibrobacteres bacterium R8-0-B4]
MSKKYGVGLKLAAAALVVAGVAGGAWAQKIPGMEVGATAPAKAAISLTFPLVATIDWIGNGTYDESKLGDDVTKYVEVWDAKSAGNLGRVKIKTNAERWDVTFSTKYGGRLFASGGKTPDKQTPPGCTPTLTNPCIPDYQDIGGEYLVYKTHNNTPNEARLQCEDCGGAGAIDTVILEMSIGAADSINVPGGYNGYYALGAEKNNTIPPTRVPKSKLKDSDTQGKEVSLAGCFADAALADPTKLYLLLQSRPNWAGKFSGATDLSSKGFPTPEKDKYEYFYVNVGIGPNNYLDIKKKANKTYTEEITFNLMVSW